MDCAVHSARQWQYYIIFCSFCEYFFIWKTPQGSPLGEANESLRGNRCTARGAVSVGRKLDEAARTSDTGRSRGNGSALGPR